MQVTTEIHTISNRHEPEGLPCSNCSKQTVGLVILQAPKVCDPVALGVIKGDPETNKRIEYIMSNNHKKKGTVFNDGINTSQGIEEQCL